MKIGVRVHDLGRNTPSELARLAKNIGFNCVQLVVNKAIVGESSLPTQLDDAKVVSIRDAFLNQGLEIAMLGAYFNPVHSKPEKVQIGIENFSNFLQYENLFKAGYVGSETGSFSDEPWVYHPKNRTREGFLESVAVFKKLAFVAEKYDAKIALEGAFGHVCYEPKVLRELYDLIGSNSIYFTIDLFNYLDISNYENYLAILDDAISTLGDRTVIFHLKDFDVVDGKLVRVDLGKGLIDYKTVLKKLLNCNKDAYFIFEGNSKEGMQDSYNFIKSIEEEVKHEIRS